MKHKMFGIGTLLALAVAGQPAMGHFQELVPEPPFADADNRTVSLEMVFTHPVEDGPVMEMGTPAQFGVLVGGKKTSLMEALQPKKIDGKTAYRAEFTAKGPGDHVFFIEPAPYWEPAEQKMIIHYTKVVVNAFGEEEGWDAMVGFPVEIEPLTRPYGLWKGNVFQGVVQKNGKPVPFAEVEVEFLNEGAKVKPPAGAFVTQVIKADANGVFTYAMPRAGWWAFAALIDGDKKIKNPEGQEAEVELGALIWVHCRDME